MYVIPACTVDSRDRAVNYSIGGARSGSPQLLCDMPAYISVNPKIILTASHSLPTNSTRSNVFFITTQGINSYCTCALLFEHVVSDVVESKMCSITRGSVSATAAVLWYPSLTPWHLTASMVHRGQRRQEQSTHHQCLQLFWHSPLNGGREGGREEGREGGREGGEEEGREGMKRRCDHWLC